MFCFLPCSAQHTIKYWKLPQPPEDKIWNHQNLKKLISHADITCYCAVEVLGNAQSQFFEADSALHGNTGTPGSKIRHITSVLRKNLGWHSNSVQQDKVSCVGVDENRSQKTNCTINNQPKGP